MARLLGIYILTSWGILIFWHHLQEQYMILDNGFNKISTNAWNDLSNAFLVHSKVSLDEELVLAPRGVLVDVSAAYRPNWNPNAQCMDDLPAFTTKTSKNDRKYAIHWASGKIECSRIILEDEFVYMGTHSFSGRVMFNRSKQRNTRSDHEKVFFCQGLPWIRHNQLLVDGNGETTILQIEVSNHLIETTVVLSIRCLTIHKRILGEMIQFDEGEIIFQIGGQ